MRQQQNKEYWEKNKHLISEKRKEKYRLAHPKKPKISKIQQRINELRDGLNINNFIGN